MAVIPIGLASPPHRAGRIDGSGETLDAAAAALRLQFYTLCLGLDPAFRTETRQVRPLNVTILCARPARKPRWCYCYAGRAQAAQWRRATVIRARRPPLRRRPFSCSASVQPRKQRRALRSRPNLLVHSITLVPAGTGMSLGSRKPKKWACAAIAMAACAALQLIACAAAGSSSAATAPRLPPDMKQWVGSPQPSDPEYRQLHAPDSKLHAMQTLLQRPMELAQFWDRSTLRQGRIVENFQQVGGWWRQKQQGWRVVGVRCVVMYCRECCADVTAT